MYEKVERMDSLNDLEREVIETAIAYRRAQIESGRDAISGGMKPVRSDLHSLYVASRVAVDNLIREREGTQSDFTLLRTHDTEKRLSRE